MINDFFSKLKKIKIEIWILLALIALGIFLRTYNFREWLYFYPDQARDLMLVDKVIKKEAPLPLLGPIAASTQFKIGPLYYYFQIISGLIFGARPETMAYPDLFFSILSIPLFYYFLKKYFSGNISLAVTGLYAISFYVIKYSRFAWNPNPIPFFILLFLMAVLEFVIHKRETRWFWIIIIGATLGVGFQLQTLLVFLLPVFCLIVFGYILIKDWRVWNKLAAIFLIFLAVNLGQLASEAESHFYNFRLLFKLSSESVESKEPETLQNISRDILCHSQANSHILSYMGNVENCDFFPLIKKALKQKNLLKSHVYMSYLAGIFMSVLFSVFGYGALVYYFKKEKEKEKKYFLGLILLFATLSALIMYPVIDSISLRYFIVVIFVPFLFLGFLAKFIAEKFSKKYFLITAAVFLFFAAANFFIIGSEAKRHFLKIRNAPQYVVLGETELMGDYIKSHSDNAKEIYLYGEGKYIQNYLKPLIYIFMERNIKLIKVKDINDLPAGKPFFCVQKSRQPDDPVEIHGRLIEDYKNFGQIGIYKLQN